MSWGDIGEPFPAFEGDIILNNPTRYEIKEEYKCPICGKVFNSVENEFRNEISVKEFNISGLCQSCQDNVFGAD